MPSALFSSPYAQLMRLHQPIGIFLLLWPCFYALALARAPIGHYALFALGAVCMRAAGCIVNDMADIRFDREVERTRTRPLASGEVSMHEALLLVALLLGVSLLIVLQMRLETVLWAAASLPLVAAYPFMKRITWWPQAFLGITFNWGALLGTVSVEGAPTLASLLLYFGCVFWTLGYDTIYAHQDKKDDARIGVKSTALRLEAHPRRWLCGFYVLSILCWALTGSYAGKQAFFYLPLGLGAASLFWQIVKVDLDNPLSCKRYFVLNAWVGGVVWAAFLMR